MTRIKLDNILAAAAAFTLSVLCLATAIVPATPGGFIA